MQKTSLEVKTQDWHQIFFLWSRQLRREIWFVTFCCTLNRSLASIFWRYKYVHLKIIWTNDGFLTCFVYGHVVSACITPSESYALFVICRSSFLFISFSFFLNRNFLIKKQIIAYIDISILWLYPPEMSLLFGFLTMAGLVSQLYLYIWEQLLGWEKCVGLWDWCSPKLGYIIRPILISWLNFFSIEFGKYFRKIKNGEFFLTFTFFFYLPTPFERTRGRWWKTNQKLQRLRDTIDGCAFKAVEFFLLVINKQIKKRNNFL